jgi:hypothetical protein
MKSHLFESLFRLSSDVRRGIVEIDPLRDLSHHIGDPSRALENHIRPRDQPTTLYSMAAVISRMKLQDEGQVRDEKKRLTRGTMMKSCVFACAICRVSLISLT